MEERTISCDNKTSLAARLRVLSFNPESLGKRTVKSTIFKAAFLANLYIHSFEASRSSSPYPSGFQEEDKGLIFSRLVE